MTAKKVIGAIFQMHQDFGEGIYFRDFNQGCTPAKEEAHVYSVRRARQLTKEGFTHKEEGKWILVYE